MRLLRLIRRNWLILCIILIASLVRFWNIEKLTTFSGDQGYDFLIIKRMLVDGDFTLLGPRIGPYNEIGNLYLGPAYYYILAPGLYMFRLDPLGASITTVLFSILTIILIYLFCKKFLNQRIGLIASIIYTLNPFLINQSRAPSNPHLIPFFSILYFYTLFRLLENNATKFVWPVLNGFSLGIMFQLHYLSIALSPFLLLLIIKKKIKHSVMVTLSFFIAISPQILFEIRNEFFVTNLFIAQIKNGENVTNLENISGRVSAGLNVLSEIFISENVLTGFAIIVLIYYVFKYLKNGNLSLIINTLAGTILVAVIALAFYAGNIEYHYFAIVYPSFAILISVIIHSFLKNSVGVLVKSLTIIFCIALMGNYISSIRLNSSEGFTMPAGWNLTGTKKVSKIIANDVDDERTFNIASTLDGDTRARPFRYLIETNGKMPQDVESYPNSDIIYLVSRDNAQTIASYNVWEISSFKPFQITNKWEIQNKISLYKLEKRI